MSTTPRDEQLNLPLFLCNFSKTRESNFSAQSLQWPLSNNTDALFVERTSSPKRLLRLIYSLTSTRRLLKEKQSGQSLQTPLPQRTFLILSMCLSALKFLQWSRQAWTTWEFACSATTSPMASRRTLTTWELSIPSQWWTLTVSFLSRLFSTTSQRRSMWPSAASPATELSLMPDLFSFTWLTRLTPWWT